MLVKGYTKVKLIAVILMVFSVNMFAQQLVPSERSRELGLTERAIQNFAAAIKSDNDGVKKSSIFLAGFYEMKEVVDILVEQLKNEPDPDTRILIALSLYKIGDKKGFEAIERLFKYDENQTVKNISAVIIANTLPEDIKLTEN